MTPRTTWGWIIAGVAVAAVTAHAQQNGPDIDPDTRIYVIRPGDTLWDISEEQYQDAWKWPRIWENNPQVENPHAIYPDEQIVMPFMGRPPAPPEPMTEPATAPVTGPVLAAPATEPAPGPVEPEQAAEMISPEESIEVIKDASDEVQQSRLVIDEDVTEKDPLRGLYVRIGDEGLLVDDEQPADISILGGPEERNLFAKGDEVYISGGRTNSDLAVGDRFYVYEREDNLQHPRTGEDLGVFIRVLGVMEVVQLHEEASTVRITDSYDSIEPKHSLMPYEPRSSEVRPFYAQDRIRGEIVRTQGAMKTIATYQLAYSDMGTNEGIEQGHLVRIFRPQEPREDPRTEEPVKLPPLQLGHAVVVDASDRASTLLIVDSTSDIHLGDLLQTVPQGG